MAVKREVHSTRGNWCRDFEAGCLSCYQPVLKSFKTSTVTHPFFNHQQTPEGRTSLAFTSALRRQYPCIGCNCIIFFMIVWAAMSEWLRWSGCDSCWDLYELLMASGRAPRQNYSCTSENVSLYTWANRWTLDTLKVLFWQFYWLWSFAEVIWQIDYGLFQSIWINF